MSQEQYNSINHNENCSKWNDWLQREQDLKMLEFFKQKRKEDERAYEERLHRIELEELDRQRRMKNKNRF